MLITSDGRIIHISVDKFGKLNIINYPTMDMLSALEALAGKISPGSGKNSPNIAGIDNNANQLKHLNHNILHHPYQKKDTQQHTSSPREK